jgi:hypothetical protein
VVTETGGFRAVVRPARKSCRHRLNPGSKRMGCVALGGNRFGQARVVCHERAVCVQRCGTVREMKEGPSRPAVRCRSQATASCCRQKRWWCCVKKVRERHAVREMKEDPSEPSCRGRLQTAMSCFGQKLW